MNSLKWFGVADFTFDLTGNRITPWLAMNVRIRGYLRAHVARSDIIRCETSARLCRVICEFFVREDTRLGALWERCQIKIPHSAEKLPHQTRWKYPADLSFLGSGLVVRLVRKRRTVSKWCARGGNRSPLFFDNLYQPMIEYCPAWSDFDQAKGSWVWGFPAGCLASIQTTSLAWPVFSHIEPICGARAPTCDIRELPASLQNLPYFCLQLILIIKK